MSLRALPAFLLISLCFFVVPGTRPLRSEGQLADVPRGPTRPRPTEAEFDRLARTDPVAMLVACEDRNRAELRGYRAILTKRERISGKLHASETVRVSVREEPFAVRMIWDAGARSDGLLGFKIHAVRYLPGDAEPMVVYRKGALAEETVADTRGPDARKAARVGIEDSGLSQAVQRTREAWAAVARREGLKVEYLGLQRHPDLGDRECHVWKRTCPEPELDPFIRGEGKVTVTDKNRANAFDTVTIWIDRETWLQLGTEQTRDGQLMARYFFRVLEMNPRFDRDEFSKAALRR